MSIYSLVDYIYKVVSSKEIPCTERHITLHDMPGGHTFFTGSHMIPLAAIEKKYGANKEAFLSRGEKLCASILGYGDASIKVFPLPRIPVIFILWLGDDEFPPRTDMLVDSTAELHLPIDIIWSIAMLSTLMMS